MVTAADPVVIGIGANIDPQRNVVAALRLLNEWAQVRTLSTAYLSPPVGLPPRAADFVNLAVELRWNGSLHGLKRRLDGVERSLGRVHSPGAAWRSRTIDLDILVAGTLLGSYGDRPYRIPHPDIERFAHAAVPLAELVGELPHPRLGRSFRAIAEEMDCSGLCPVPLPVVGAS